MGVVSLLTVLIKRKNDLFLLRKITWVPAPETEIAAVA